MNKMLRKDVKSTKEAQQAISKNSAPTSNGYLETLNKLKEKIRSTQIKAVVKVNQELIQLYWEIGIAISEKQEKEGWGAKTIEKLAKDLKNAFPDTKGFSRTNISYMVQFAKEYPEIEIIQQLVGQIPWGHNLVLIQRLNNKEERLWYVEKIIENGWSRNMLSIWIDSDLYRRQGKAVTNFSNTLPPPQSDLANQTLKDPYCFDFLSLTKKYEERDLEKGLTDHIQKFLVELGKGFAFVGKQYELKIENTIYYLDLLFYHLELNCFCVIELKGVAFKPEYAGKINFYLSAVDDLIKRPHDNPSIGILLCKDKNKTEVEYALRDIKKPIGVASYETEIVKSLPENLKSSLPSVEEIEAEINRDIYDQ
jgi:predicted nuclease of restriction endonuclease-like (RecB) superfamily